MAKLICEYCGDPILPFQEKTMKDGMHKGCYELKKEEDESRKSNERRNI